MVSNLRRSLDNASVYFMFRRVLSRDYRRIKRVIKEEGFIQESANYLDLACGVGDLSYLFASSGYTGVDLNVGCMAYARERFSRDFVVADARWLPLKGEAFHGVLTVAFFHHLSDEQAVEVITEAHRVLQAGGRFLVIDAVRPLSRFNLIGRILMRWDRGRHIRLTGQYRRLLAQRFLMIREYYIQVWPYDYCVLVLTKDET